MLEELAEAVFGPVGLGVLAFAFVDRMADGNISRKLTRGVVRAGYLIGKKGSICGRTPSA